ncbi:MAG TPA: NADPH:quinone oxidoreductase family protein [Pseudolabrys sp.]|nr:NADPH:quinone oxidoreductase family protein [Pseudolabrys sp.]
MKAAVCHEWGGPLVLHVEERPRPALSANEVRVAVRSAGIAFQDTLLIAGKYQTKPNFPVCPGNEICAEVEECGNGVRNLKPGDKIIALLPSGGYAEQAILAEGSAVKIASEIDDYDAGVLGMAYGTAYQALVGRAQLKAGEYLLVRGAGGGVGLPAVQIGAALGARVIAVASSKGRRERAMASGAHHAIDSAEPNFRDAVFSLTGGQGADVILDTVGREFREQVLRCVRRRGRILIVGFAGGEIPQIPAHYILNKLCSVIGVSWGYSVFLDEPANYRATLEAIVAMYEAGAIKPNISRIVSLSGVREVLADIIANRLDGRAVIAIDRSP